MSLGLDYPAMLAVALAEARIGLAEGGIPIGAAIFDASGQLVGAGHRRMMRSSRSAWRFASERTFSSRPYREALAASAKSSSGKIHLVLMTRED